MDLGLEMRRLAAWAQTQGSPVLPVVDVAELVLAAGWSGEDAVKAVAVCGAESGYRTRAININRKSGTGDYGLFQINDIHNPTEEDRYEPAANVRKAYAVWKGRSRWDPDPFRAWMAYANNKHLAFMDVARAAVAEAEARKNP